MNFIHDFQQDLRTILTELDSGRPFAFNRFADGELAILEERDIPTADGWSAVNVSGQFRERLRAALTYRDKDYYLGLGCPCCNRPEWERLMALAGRDPDDPQVTFSNVFVNGNYGNLPPYGSFHWFNPKANFVNADDHLLDDQIDAWHAWMHDPINKSNVPLFVSAGPAGKIFIHEMWLRGMRRSIIDIGSAFDTSGRSYHDPNHPNRTKICQWSPKTIDNGGE